MDESDLGNETTPSRKGDVRSTLRSFANSFRGGRCLIRTTPE